MPPEEELRARIRARLTQGQAPAAPAPDPTEALRERVRARLYGQDVENALPKMAEVAADAAQKVDLNNVRRATAEIRARFGNTPEGARELTRIKNTLPTLEAAEASPKAVERLAERAQDPKVLERVKARLAETQGPQNGWDKMSPLGKFGHVVGLPGTMLREGLAAAASDKKDFEPMEAIRGNSGSGEQFVKTIEEAAGRGGILANAIDAPLSAISTAAGGIGTAIGAAPAALADKLSGRGGPDPGWALAETLKDSPKTTKGTVAELLLDPLTYLGFGGGAKGAVGVALKQGERIAPNSARFAEALGKVAGKYGGRVELPKMVEALAKKHGVPMTEVERVLGRDARFLGKGQMTVGAPFATEKATMEVVGPLDKALRTVTGGKVRAPEQLGRRAMEPVASAVYRAAPATARAFGVLPPDWGANLNTAIQRQAAKARNAALQRTGEELEIFRDQVAKLAPADKARREEIVRAVLDADYDARKIADVPPESGKWLPNQLEGWRKSWDKFMQPGEVHTRITRDDNGNQVLVAVAPKPGQDPAGALAALTGRERQFVDAFADYMERQRRGLVDAGLLDEAASGKNLLTDRYVPRLWRATEDGMSLTEAAAPRSGTASPLKSRGPLGGRAIGRGIQEGIDVIADPFEIVGKVQPKLEVAKQKTLFRQWAASHLGTPVNAPDLPHTLSMKRTHEVLRDAKGVEVWVPKEALAKMEQQFAASARPNGVGGKALQWLNARFKGMQTMGTPRYVFTNVLGDSTFMAAAGFRDARWFKRAQSLPKMADNAIAVVGPTRNYSAREIRQLLQENGVWKGGAAGRGFEIDPSRGLAKAQRSFQESAETGARAAGELNDSALQRAGKWAGRRKTELLEDAGSLLWRRIGEKINDTWDREAKAAFFMDRLSKGDAPNVAAARTFEVLFDYADQNEVIKSLSNFLAFPVWRMKAMSAVPKTIARNPWTVPVTEAAVDLASDPYADPAPQYARAQTYNVAMGDTGRKLVGAATEALGGGPLNPGYGVGVSFRSPLAEAITPMLELTQGNPDPMASGLSPFMVPAWETLTKQDYISRQDLQRPGLTTMFPSGMPGVPDALKTETNPNDPAPQIAWAARYLPQFFLSPQAMAAANQGLEGQYLGRSKPTAPTDAMRNALRWIGIGTGLPLYVTSPADRIQELQRDSQVGNAAEFLKNTKTGMKRR